MGRIGQNIGQEHVKQAVIKSLQHILSKNSRITMTLREANNLVECYGGDDETEITISRFKDDNKLYGWYTDYPEEGRMLLEDDNHFPSEMKKLTMDLKLPYYQNTILTTLSAWILEELDQAQRLVDHANNIRTDQFSLDNSYGFYTTKHQNFSNELITDIISGHEYNLTVMLALLDYIKGFVNTDILTSLDFHFLKKSSPFIWELFTTFDKPEQSQQVKTVMEQYKNERKFGNMRQPQYDL
jgi:hypothetical protein